MEGEGQLSLIDLNYLPLLWLSLVFLAGVVLGTGINGWIHLSIGGLRHWVESAR